MSFQWFKKSSIAGLKNSTHDTQQPETSKGTGASTILDVLNSYCWKVILDMLDINDVMRSERVSRGWQLVVLEYLQGVHNFGIRNAGAQRSSSNHFRRLECQNGHLIHIDFKYKDHFDQMIQKIGPFVVQLSTDCICDRSLVTIAESCPNIEYLGFYDINFDEVNLMPTTTSVQNAVESLDTLKRISFDTCRQLQNFFSCMFTNNKTFEGLEFINSCSSYIIDLALNFWLDYKWTNLKSVTLSRLNESETSLIEWSGIEIASNNWTKLTKLHLDYNSMRICANLYRILENVHNLELISLCGYDKYFPDSYHRTDIVLMDDDNSSRGREWNDTLVESIGRHSGLRHLYLTRNDNVDNEWLDTLARRCKELRTLDIGSCKAVSSLGALQALAATLEKLSLPDNRLVTDTDLIDCIKVCHRLTFLDVSRCSGATPRLVRGAERATQHRAPPLQLRLDETDMSTVQILKAAGFDKDMQKRRESYPWYLPQEIQVRHKGLTLHWSNKAPEAHLPLRGPLAAEYRYDSVLGTSRSLTFPK